MNITTMLENPVELTREMITENPTLQARLADLKKRDEEYTKISSSLPLNIDYTRLDHTQLKAVVYTRCKYFLSHILYDPITNAPVLAYDVMCKILYDSKAGMTANDPVFMSDTLSNMFIKNMLKSRKSGNIPNSILTTDFKLNKEEKTIVELINKINEVYTYVSKKILSRYPKHEKHALGDRTKNELLGAVTNLIQARDIPSARFKHLQAAQAHISTFEALMQNGYSLHSPASLDMVITTVMKPIASYKEEKGLPLGNISSQIFSNVYMNVFDQQVKRVYKIKYYVRYADDMFFIVDGKDAAKELKNRSIEFLKSILNLTVCYNKVNIVKNISVDALGLKVTLDGIYLTKRSKDKFKQILKNSKDVAHSLNSWFGAKSLAKCFNFINNNICKKNNLSFKTNKFTIS